MSPLISPVLRNRSTPWVVNAMKNSIGIDMRVLARDARAAGLATVAAPGSASPPAATLSAEPITIFCAGQMMTHTLVNIVMPRMAPNAMDVPGTLWKYVLKSLPRFFWNPRIISPVRSVSSAPKRNHHSARQVILRRASERLSAVISAKAGVWTKLK